MNVLPHFALVALLGALVCARAPAAQVSVAGKVTDENGLAVPSVRIEVRGTVSEPATVATSDLAGGFSLQLPESGDYEVRADRPGFFVYQGRSQLLAGPNELSITLNHVQEFFQTVDVAYPAPAIDPQEPAEKKQLTSVEILEIPYPASQDLRNALPLLPGVVQDNVGRLHFNGGSTDQTNFTLDGFNISDPVTGRFEARMNIEAVRTLDVESSRFSADKGRGSAGTVDVKTAMGDDRWRFGATNFFPSLTTQDQLHINKWTPRLKVSGPIARGRAWFSNSFDSFYAVDTVSGLPRGENWSRAFTASNLTRLQVNLRPTNILTASLLYNYIDQDRNGLSFLEPVETTVNRRQDLYFGSVKDQHYFHGGGLIELGFGMSDTFTRESPQGPATFEILPTGTRGNYFVDLTREARREQWTANAYLPSKEFFGTHQLLLGADVERTKFERLAKRHDYEVLREDLSVARLVRFAGSGVCGLREVDASEYVQDRWSPRDGLLVEAGVRADWNDIVRDLLISPRLSVAYAPKRLRDTKISAGIGVFQDALSLATISLQRDQIAMSTFFDPLGNIRRGPVETRFQINPHDLHMPRYRIASLSVERKLPLEFYGKANYVRKVGQQGFTFINEGDGLGLPEGVPGAPTVGVYRLHNWRNDRYDALELTVRRTFGGKFEWWAGYTRSRARSDSVVDYSLENPIFSPQGRGPFSWDTPNRFQSWGWAPVPKRLLPQILAWLLRDTDVSYLLEYRAGFPFSVVNEEGFLVGQPNGRRLPSYLTVNLSLERRFRFLHYLWAWRGGVINVTNALNPNVVNNNLDSPNFLTYGRGQPRAFNVRLRFLGRR